MSKPIIYGKCDNKEGDLNWAHICSLGFRDIREEETLRRVALWRLGCTLHWTWVFLCTYSPANLGVKTSLWTVIENFAKSEGISHTKILEQVLGYSILFHPRICTIDTVHSRRGFRVNCGRIYPKIIRTSRHYDCRTQWCITLLYRMQW